MKNQIVIIEDDYYRFFSLKHILESKLKISIDIQGSHCHSDLMERFAVITPKPVVLNGEDGVIALLNTFRKRNINRRNTSITIFVTNEEASSLLLKKLKTCKSSEKLAKAA